MSGPSTSSKGGGGSILSCCCPCQCIQHIVEDANERIDNIQNKIELWSDIGRDCCRISMETKQICIETQQQRELIIDYATTIRSTLENGFSSSSSSSSDGSTSTTTDKSINNKSRSVQNSNQSSSSSSSNSGDILNTIRELTAGDKVRSMMDVAKGLNGTATKCVEQAIELSTLLQKGKQELPRFIQKRIDTNNMDDHDDDDDDDDDNNNNNNPGTSSATTRTTTDEGTTSELLRAVEQDIQDVEQCVKDIRELNLQNALTTGLNAFRQLSEKSSRSKLLFEQIENYANDIYYVTNTTLNRNKLTTWDAVKTIRKVSRSTVRCIRKSDVMKCIAEMAGKLLRIIIELFQLIADKISNLWSALAYAKDKMVNCLKHVVQSKLLCTRAIHTTVTLIDKSRSVSETFQLATQFNFQAIKKLLKNGEIQTVIDLATSIDDVIIECTQQIVIMIKEVNTGYSNFPPFLTTGIDKENAGKRSFDPMVPDIETNVQELETCTRGIMIGSDDTNNTSTSSSSVRGFTDISNHGEKCLQMLRTFDEFTKDGERTIQSFLNVWSIHGAVDKMNDICRIVTLGELMEQYIKQIGQLIRNMIQYLKQMKQKCNHMKQLPGTALDVIFNNNNNNNNDDQNDSNYGGIGSGVLLGKMMNLLK